MTNVLKVLNFAFIVLLIISTMSFLVNFAPWALGAIAGWQLGSWFRPLLSGLDNWVDERTNREND